MAGAKCIVMRTSRARRRASGTIQSESFDRVNDLAAIKGPAKNGVVAGVSQFKADVRSLGGALARGRACLGGSGDQESNVGKRKAAAASEFLP